MRSAPWTSSRPGRTWTRERIGFTGESGGGNSTYWVAALDPRVVLAVPVSAVTTFDHWIRTDVNWDWHQRPPGVRRRADIGTLLALHAPHPLLVISSRRGTDDQEFPLHEAEKSFQWAKHVYGLLSAEDAAAHYESTTAHGYQEDKRARLYRAVERWLRPPFPKGDQELPARVENVDDLRCGLPEDNLTVRAIYARVAETAAASEHALRSGRAASVPARAPRLAGTAARDRRRRRSAGRTNGPWSAEFWLLEPEPGIRLPAVRIGGKGATGPMTLIPGRDEQAVAHALRGRPPGPGIRPARARARSPRAPEACGIGPGSPAVPGPASRRSISSRPRGSAARRWPRRRCRWTPGAATAGPRSWRERRRRNSSTRVASASPSPACATRYGLGATRPSPTCRDCWNAWTSHNFENSGRREKSARIGREATHRLAEHDRVGTVRGRE